jgi:hypothetical protein
MERRTIVNRHFRESYTKQFAINQRAKNPLSYNEYTYTSENSYFNDVKQKHIIIEMDWNSKKSMFARNIKNSLLGNPSHITIRLNKT